MYRTNLGGFIIAFLIIVLFAIVLGYAVNSWLFLILLLIVLLFFLP